MLVGGDQNLKISKNFNIFELSLSCSKARTGGWHWTNEKVLCIHSPIKKTIQTFEKPAYNEMKRCDIYSKMFCKKKLLMKRYGKSPAVNFSCGET